MARSRKYRLIANRPGLMATPTLNGSDVAFPGTQYDYTAMPASLFFSCESGLGNYLFDFGDGSRRSITADGLRSPSQIPFPIGSRQPIFRPFLTFHESSGKFKK